MYYWFRLFSRTVFNHVQLFLKSNSARNRFPLLEIASLLQPDLNMASPKGWLFVYARTMSSMSIAQQLAAPTIKAPKRVISVSSASGPPPAAARTSKKQPILTNSSTFCFVRRLVWLMEIVDNVWHHSITDPDHIWRGMFVQWLGATTSRTNPQNHCQRWRVRFATSENHPTSSKHNRRDIVAP